MSKQYSYLIVGAGLFGSTFAYEANKSGQKSLVIDRRNHVGGNIYCDTIEGINVHKYGPHIFHTSSKMIWDYINQFNEFNGYINSPIVNYNGEVYNLPFNMNTFNRLWGLVTPQEARLKIEKEKIEANCPDPKNFEEEAINSIGLELYEKLVKGYTEKQWGRKASDLPGSIFKRIPIRFTYDNNYFDDMYQGIPVGGYNVIIEKMLEGCDVELGVDYLENKVSLNNLADKVIFTGMIDEYFRYQFGPLEYRSLRFEDEVLDTENYQGNAVVNFTDKETPYTRTIEHKHFEFGRQPKTVITREYPREWQPGDEPYYPINDDKNNELYEKYKALASREKNVIFGGRLAEYKYYDMDEVLVKALEAVEKEFNQDVTSAIEQEKKLEQDLYVLGK